MSTQEHIDAAARKAISTRGPMTGGPDLPNCPHCHGAVERFAVLDGPSMQGCRTCGWNSGGPPATVVRAQYEG